MTGFNGSSVNLNPLNAIPLKCVSMSNQECILIPAIMNINSNEPLCYPYSIPVNVCSGSCHSINDPYTKLHILDVVKNSKVFNLM